MFVQVYTVLTMDKQDYLCYTYSGDIYVQLHTLYGNQVPVYTATEALPLILQQITDNTVDYKSGKRKRKVVNTINTFDIETTTVKNLISESTNFSLVINGFCPKYRLTKKK